MADTVVKEGKKRKNSPGAVTSSKRKNKSMNKTRKQNIKRKANPDRKHKAVAKVIEQQQQQEA